ncbi:MAG: altronate dehydratase [Synergistetes bacterium]|nr:altronate dehydratase [Synergistota bacterium]
MKKYVKLGSEDNVVVALVEVRKGEKILENIIAIEDIPAGHKVAIKEISAGEKIIKYDHPIGIATCKIKPGEWVHVHNLKTTLTPEWKPRWIKVRKIKLTDVKHPSRTFMGYLRESGEAGTRNEIWVIPTVGCINGILRKIITDIKKPEWIDDIKVLSHPYGCSQLGGDLELTRDILAGLARNPNAGGVLIVGLGCENLQIDTLKEKLLGHPNIAFATLQDIEDEFHTIQSILSELMEKAKAERKECPLSALTVGVKCGGSDSFSGLTANPLVGKLADYLVHHGGTILMSEIPEIFGAEDTIISRIEDEETYEKFVKTINWFRDYYTRYGQPIYENPSPGNIKGGITTLEEKSLGAVKKSGSGTVSDVLRYGETAKKSGVNIVFGPGNDLVSSTALAGSGATIILFTTGRGTPYGTVVPTVKISSNSSLYERKANWIDFNAGKIAEGADTEEVLSELIKLVISVASGEKTKSEKNGFHEIAIFKDGVIL